MPKAQLTIHCHECYYDQAGRIAVPCSQACAREQMRLKAKSTNRGSRRPPRAHLDQPAIAMRKAK